MSASAILSLIEELLKLVPAVVDALKEAHVIKSQNEAHNNPVVESNPPQAPQVPPIA